MLGSVFNNILDFLIRNVDYSVRIIISVALYISAVVFMILSIRVKNDNKPLSIGWFVLTIIALFLGTIYVAL